MLEDLIIQQTRKRDTAFSIKVSENFVGYFHDLCTRNIPKETSQDYWRSQNVSVGRRLISESGWKLETKRNENKHVSLDFFYQRWWMFNDNGSFDPKLLQFIGMCRKSDAHQHHLCLSFLWCWFKCSHNLSDLANTNRASRSALVLQMKYVFKKRMWYIRSVPRSDSSWCPSGLLSEAPMRWSMFLFQCTLLTHFQTLHLQSGCVLQNRFMCDTQEKLCLI